MVNTYYLSVLTIWTSYPYLHNIYFYYVSDFRLFYATVYPKHHTCSNFFHYIKKESSFLLLLQYLFSILMKKIKKYLCVFFISLHLILFFSWCIGSESSFVIVGSDGVTFYVNEMANSTEFNNFKFYEKRFD